MADATIALLPVKALRFAKQRLAPLLTEKERAFFSLAMARDVLTALCATPELNRILVCAGDATTVAMARGVGVDVIAEVDLYTGGLNEIVAKIAHKIANSGGKRLLVAHADLPGIHADDFSMLCRALDTAEIAAAPDARCDGTNLLAWHLQCDLQPVYGIGSFLKFQQQAQQKNLVWTNVELPRAQHDIDTPEDLIALAQIIGDANPSNTRTFLLDSGIAARLNF